MKPTLPLLTFALSTALLGCASRPGTFLPQPNSHPREQSLLGVLRSPDTDLKAKYDACRELARIGSHAALPVLAPLLTNAELSHMACYALETMPGDPPNVGLRQALDNAQGRVLLGLITTLGVRRDPGAVPSLQRYLTHPDPEMQRAAAHALGNIATPSAIQSLAEAWTRAQPRSQPALAEGLLRAAEHCRSSGDSRRARRIYETLWQSAAAPVHIRAAALTGLLSDRGAAQPALWREALLGPELAFTHAALHAAQSIPSPATTQILIDPLPFAPPERQILILQTLAVRKDPVALRAILTATNNPAQAVRLAALRAVGELADPRAVDPLLPWITHAEEPMRDAARAALASLPGRSVDQAILRLLDRPEAPLQLAGLDLVNRRRLADAIPKLERMTASENPAVRQAAIRQIGELGHRTQWPSLLHRLRQFQTPEDLTAAREALFNLAQRIQAGPQETEAVLTTLNHATPAQASVLYALLAQLGGEKGLRLATTTARSGPPELRAAAFQALMQWRTPDVTDVLATLAEESDDPRQQQDALRRYLQWASDTELPEDRRLAMCRRVQRLIHDPATAKHFLAAIGTLTSPEVIPMVRPLLENPDTREEACAAIVNVAERLRQRTGRHPLPEPVLLALATVAKTTGNPELAKRAQALQQPAD